MRVGGHDGDLEGAADGLRRLGGYNGEADGRTSDGIGLGSRGRAGGDGAVGREAGCRVVGGRHLRLLAELANHGLGGDGGGGVAGRGPRASG